jgi:hypothetical protein
MSTKKTIEDGYLMSQYDIGQSLGLNQRTISKAERAMLIKLKTGLDRNNISLEEFLQFIKYRMD